MKTVKGLSSKCNNVSLMKKLLVLLFITSCVTTQPLINVKTSTEFDINYGPEYNYIQEGSQQLYFSHMDQIVAIKIDGNVINFQQFDSKNLRETKRSEFVHIKNSKQRFIHEEFIQQKDKILEFYSLRNKETYEDQLFYQTFTFDNLTPGRNKLLATTERLQNRLGRNKIDVFQSIDQSKILMVYEFDNEIKNDRKNFQRIGMIAFDNEMNELWNNEITMPYAEAFIENMGFTVDNDGNAYMLIQEKNKKELTPLELIILSGSSKPNTVEVANGSFFPKGMKLQQGNNGQIYCAGFYGGRVNASGVYTSIVGPNGFIKETLRDFPKSFINGIKEYPQPENEIYDPTDGIPNLTLDQVVVHDDGSTTLLGEIFKAIKETNGTNSIVKYYYRDVIVLKFDAEGELSWFHNMEKDQYKATAVTNYGTGYYQFKIITAGTPAKYPLLDMSYKHVYHNGFHYLLYFDNTNNIGKPSNQTLTQYRSYKNSYFAAYQINDVSGMVRKLNVLDPNGFEGSKIYNYGISKIIDLKNGTLVLEVYVKNGLDQLIEIKILE